ncbi:Serine/threonine-protein kinase SRPK [Emericellopsis cladophorae]|uniref:Serine/threonine-protein kinase SRPK n=1 Tax=Emericellopsis cladophorae TaxID=2686198 RepID=A0A9Q0BBM4_9HYPO|nr:Serine/threonine-protein kinase SRPK [Emericellopsis cladophorae]KAI6779942.1 Serine/threonine-protein kinase SRPK [Emericellopsis cladophorae]
MSFLTRWFRKVPRAPLHPPRQFPTHRGPLLPVQQLLEEETLPRYSAEHYYPARIGEVLGSQYQIVSKLGFGSTSTVWLARDLNSNQHVALKVFVLSQAFGGPASQELGIHARLASSPQDHPGREAIPHMLGSFEVSSAEGDHQCLVHQPLWNNLQTYLDESPDGRLSKEALANVLYNVFKALDYLHPECQIVHTDIKPDNIMFGFKDDAALEAVEQAEVDNPSPRKEIDGRVVYRSRRLPEPRNIGPPVLCDFGSALSGPQLRDTDVQPDEYRCPEMILDIPWDNKIDVWNVGCMVWHIFEGEHLFRGIDPELKVYRGRAHLAEMIAVLGQPQPGLIDRGRLKSKFFSDKCEWQAGNVLLPPTSLEQLEKRLEGNDKELFIDFMNKMLQWAPEDRQTPEELMTDPWLMRHVRG